MRGSNLLSVFNSHLQLTEEMHRWVKETLTYPVISLAARNTVRRFDPLQWEYMTTFCNPKVRIFFTICNRGGFKSLGSAISMCFLITHVPNFEITFVSGSKDEALKVYGRYFSPMIHALQNQFPPNWIIKQTQTECNFDTGSSISVVPCTERGVRASRAAMVVIDEGCEVPNEIIGSVFGQLTTNPIMLRITTTPHRYNHPLREKWENAQKYGIKTMHWDHRRCWWMPIENAMIYKEFNGEDLFLVDYLAQWHQVEGHIIPASKIELACKMRKPTNFTKIVIGVDWGQTKLHPCGIVVLGFGHIDRDKDVRYVIEAYRHEAKSTPFLKGEIIRLAIFYSAKVYIEGTQAGKAVCGEVADELKQSGIDVQLRVMQAGKGKNAFVIGVKADFETEHIGMDEPKCRPLVEELNGWHYDDKGELPEKGKDDCVDSYMIARGEQLREKVFFFEAG